MTRTAVAVIGAMAWRREAGGGPVLISLIHEIDLIRDVCGESPNYPPQPMAVQTHFLSGTEGSLTLPTLDHWRCTSGKSWFAPIMRDSVRFERGDPYSAQLDHLARVVRGKEPPLITARGGALTLRATMAVHKAAKTGQIVRPDQEMEL